MRQTAVSGKEARLQTSSPVEANNSQVPWLATVGILKAESVSFYAEKLKISQSSLKAETAPRDKALWV